MAAQLTAPAPVLPCAPLPPLLQEFKCDLLKSLSDLTLRQNDERTATLRALLDSESALEGGEGGDGAAAGGSDSQSDEGL